MIDASEKNYCLIVDELGKQIPQSTGTFYTENLIEIQ